MGPGQPTTRTVLRIVLIVVLAAAALYLLFLLRRPLSWIFIAAFIAVALSGPVSFLARRMRRGLAITLTYLAVILFPFLLGAIVIPPLVSQLSELVDQAPEYAADLREFVTESERLRQLEEDYQIVEKLQERAEELPARIGDAAGVLGDLGLGLVNSVFALLTILVLSVFMMAGGPRWLHALLSQQPPEMAERVERTLGRVATAVGNYVAGALVQATIAGVTTFVLLTILGMPFAAPLAVIVFLFDLVPLIGATLGAVVVGIVTLFNDFPTTTIVWLVYSIVYQQIENNIIQPQIQKRAVEVQPIVVLVSVLFGSTLFGVIGALLAIPVAASFQIAFREWWAWRTHLRGTPDVVLPPGVDAAPPPPPAPPAEPPPAPA